MLIIKAFINEKEIDEIYIHNVKTIDEKYDIHEYRIKKPEGYDHIPLYHVRFKGWKPLAIDALKILEDSNGHG